ncbi:PLP-dependent aminotransferase family protein [Ferrimonas sp. SCSIO 43195]|uniref:aminotransferase-like domain-containing protein n=1 Tax=Ferrimonas sp. SCSIO 43195 TaxID=2822844 RepID=UPI002074C6D6|nr:PLP-dependent aminotransferase family protein [Ferrimonas sp. SCSIO 43195]USD35661.1 PLP-dependent aminotransferase family protein [Ferrimonas sp. SCSIO 43195]
MSKFLYQQLASSLSERIHSAEWLPGDRLPSIRQLSQQHRVAKISVQKALHALEAAGLVEARPRSGYFVAQRQHVTVATHAHFVQKPPQLIQVPEIFHEIMARSAAFDLCPWAPLPEPQPSLERLNRHLGRAMRQQPKQKAFYYTGPEGNLALRQQIHSHYRSRQCALDVNEICITSGCQNSLFLALMSCCEPGDVVAVESPAFYGVLQLLQQLKLKVVEVPASPTLGLSADALQPVLQQWDVKACVVTPNYATPTGACMPAAEKRRLVELTLSHDFTLIEDDIYGDLGFHFQPEPLKRFDTHGRVILCSSFSKSLSRDLRIGWISGGRHHDRIVHLKLINQLASGQALQEGLASFMAEGHFKRHLVHQRQQLKHNRDRLLAVLNQQWQVPFRCTQPEGGMSLWIELAPEQDTKAHYQSLLRNNIVITPGALFSANGQYAHYLRLSFAHSPQGPRYDALMQLNRAFSNPG